MGILKDILNEADREVYNGSGLQEVLSSVRSKYNEVANRANILGVEGQTSSTYLYNRLVLGKSDTDDDKTIDLTTYGNTNAFVPDEVILIDFDVQGLTNLVNIEFAEDIKSHSIQYSQIQETKLADDLWSYARNTFWVCPTIQGFDYYQDFRPELNPKKRDVIYSRSGYKLSLPMGLGKQIITEDGHLDSNVLKSQINRIGLCGENDYAVLAKTFIPVFLDMGLPAWGNMDYYSMKGLENVTRYSNISYNKNADSFIYNNQYLTIHIDHTSGFHTGENTVTQLAIEGESQNESAAGRYVIKKYVLQVNNFPEGGEYDMATAKLMYNEEDGGTYPEIHLIDTLNKKDIILSQEYYSWNIENMFSNDASGDRTDLIKKSDNGIPINLSNSPAGILYTMPLIAVNPDTNQDIYMFESCQQAMRNVTFNGENPTIEALIVYLNSHYLVYDSTQQIYLKRWTNQLGMKFASLKLNESENAYDRLYALEKRKAARTYQYKPIPIEERNHYTIREIEEDLQNLVANLESQGHKPYLFKGGDPKTGKIYIDVYYDGDSFKNFSQRKLPNEKWKPAIYLKNEDSYINKAENTKPTITVIGNGWECSSFGRAGQNINGTLEISNKPYLMGYSQMRGADKKDYRIHRAIATTFKQKELLEVWKGYRQTFKSLGSNFLHKPISNTDEPYRLVVHHIDGDKAHMRPENLAWVVSAENTRFERGMLNGIGLFRIDGEKEECVAAVPFKENAVYNGNYDIAKYGDVLDLAKRIIKRNPKPGKNEVVIDYEAFGEFCQYAIKIKELTDLLNKTSYIYAGETNMYISSDIKYILRLVLFRDTRFLMGREDSKNDPYALKMAKEVIGYAHKLPNFSVTDSGGENVIEEFKYADLFTKCETIADAEAVLRSIPEAVEKGYKIKVSERHDKEPRIHFTAPGDEGDEGLTQLDAMVDSRRFFKHINEINNMMNRIK